MFKRIDHIELLTLQPELIVRFYTEVLAFTERDRMTIPDTPFGALELIYLDLGDTTIEVMSYAGAESISPRNSDLTLGWQALALEVQDFDKAIDFLAEKKIDIVWGPIKRQEYARAEIRDPDGNPIEIRQWYR